jgi:cobalt-precorrin-5B (C1)-methyltransferase
MQSAEHLRTGYTTGACAAAAARAALLALLDQRVVADVAIRLPGGQMVTFRLHSCTFEKTEAAASVIKDAGDDPDATHLAEICARVHWSTEPGVTFRRGVGVGLVTKKGLPVPPGEPAINPAPRQLMTAALQEILAERNLTGRGLVVEISVPRGEELAKKTFNPRLGIVGGISILGTTGIVVPYSTAAWLASVTQEIDVATAQELRELVLTVGARGERLARQLFPLAEEAFIQIGPFFGDALRHCDKCRVHRVILAAMIGKLAKFAAGNESVHSNAGSQDFAFLAAIAQTLGAASAVVDKILHANTAQEVAEIVLAGGPARFFDVLCEKAWACAAPLAPHVPVLFVCLMSQDGVVLGQFPRMCEAAHSRS